MTVSRSRPIARPPCGLGKPETFNFPGFTHICARNRRGGFLLEPTSRRDRMNAKLRAIKEVSSASFTHGPSSALPPDTQGGSRMPNWARPVLCGGREVTHVPTATCADPAARRFFQQR
jgi:hypothetical protein